MDTLKEHTIPLGDCMAQAYNRTANMVGKYKDVRAKIREQCLVAIFSLYGYNTLNLCGNGAARRYNTFWNVQTLYSLFSPAFPT